MSYKYECPNCFNQIEIEAEALPDQVCDTEEVDCPRCEAKVEIGISVEVHVVGFKKSTEQTAVQE